MPLTIDQLLTPEITKPARYLGTELGSVHKPWDGAIVRWCLTYPEIYEVGASNLGHIILYNIINTQPRQLCDRAYLPASDLAAKLRSSHTPLFAVESRRSLQTFDILGFSLSYELGATNILEMLDLAQIPLTWAERHASHPLIFAGGQTATSNPEPYADFFDFIVLGDGEELLPEIGLVVEMAKTRQQDRESLLLSLAQVPGVYVPRFYAPQADGSVQPLRNDVPQKILRRVATPIPAYSIGLVPYVETVHDRLTIEIRRGCTRGCRFCQPGMLTRPARDVAPEAVVDAITEGMRATGHNEFSLLSLSCSDYLALPALGVELKNRLKDDNISLSLPSQRVDRFDENIANIIGGTRQTGITFAPEAGTQRLRDIINKGLTNEELLRGVKTAYEQGWTKIKLYFMVGLPGETDDDVVGIAETVRWLRRECQGRRRLDFNITISNFTPKPHTPFQWHSVSTQAFAYKHGLLKAEFRGLRGVKVNFTDVRISAMEDFVGRGDRRLGSVVKRAWELGAGMDAWWESLDRAHAAWTEAIEEAGLGGKYRDVEQGHFFWQDDIPNPDDSLAKLPLPWDHLDTGIDKQWLWDDLQKALQEATVPDCSFDGCSHCGVCSVDFGHNEVVPPPTIPEFVGHFQPKNDRLQRQRLRFGKRGDLRFLSHLDLVRLFDRAVRRAALPVAYSGGFHPMPRIIPGSALTLGLTSDGELWDLELHEPMDSSEIFDRLAAQLPTDIPLYGVEEVPIASPTITQVLHEARYQIQLQAQTVEGEPKTIAPETWQTWIQTLLASPEILIPLTTKSGKIREVNLRERLMALQWVSSPVDAFPPDAMSGVLDYQGACRNDGTFLKPDHVALLLETIVQREDPDLTLQLKAAHRLALFTQDC